MTRPSKTLEMILQWCLRHALPREWYLDDSVFRNERDLRRQHWLYIRLRPLSQCVSGHLEVRIVRL